MDMRRKKIKFKKLTWKNFVVVYIYLLCDVRND